MKVMQMREFLRGGYKDITELTLVTNHSRPAFTVNPHTTKRKRANGDMSVSHSTGVLAASGYQAADAAGDAES